MEDIKNKYIHHFLKDLTLVEKEEIYFDQFIWHAFSFKKIPCLEGLEAIHAFNQREKNEVYLFFQHHDSVLEMKDLTYQKLLDLIQDKADSMDCYVVDKDFKWSFVFTHETVKEGNLDWKNPYYIGPFFIER